MKRALLVGTLFFLLVSCGGGGKKVDESELQAEAHLKGYQLELEVGNKARSVFAPISLPALNESNPITEEKITLGKLLYFDNRLSKDGTQSCNTCHNLATFGVDNLPTSPGDAGENGGRNSPTVLNAAFHTTQFWDGRAKDVEEQAGMPILNPVEMAIPSEEFLVKRLSEVAMYKEMFAKAFPNQKNPLTYENIRKSIAAFERTLNTPSAFDAYLQGNSTALNNQEKEGLMFFIDKGCTTCHNGVNLGGSSFQKFGVYEEYWKHTNSKKIDEGRFEVTAVESDKYFFRVPTLRNITKTAPYFHDGSVERIEDAVKIMAKVNLAVDLTDKEVESMVAFLHTLTGALPVGVAEMPKELQN